MRVPASDAASPIEVARPAQPADHGCGSPVPGTFQMKQAEGVSGAVYAEQVAVVFRQMPIAVAVNFVNAALTALVVASMAVRPFALPWFASIIIVTIGRWILWLRYRRTPVRHEDAPYWSRLAPAAPLLTRPAWGVRGGGP